MIEFRNVSKVYDTGTEAVHNANFTINKGDFAFLVGSSGSGKSTLIKLILKEEPTSGKYNKWKRYNFFKAKESSIFKKKHGCCFPRFQTFTR